MSKFDYVVIALLSGVTGNVIGQFARPTVESAQIFYEDNRPAVMRLYTDDLHEDVVFVEDKTRTDNTFVTLDDHLETVPESERRVEEAKVLQAAGRY